MGICSLERKFQKKTFFLATFLSLTFFLKMRLNHKILSLYLQVRNNYSIRKIENVN